MSRHNSSNVFRIQPITIKRAKAIRATRKRPQYKLFYVESVIDGWVKT